MDDDGDVLAARPLALDGQRPQVRVLRRTVEQIGDVVPLVPTLADSAPQMVDELMAVLARCDTPIADQVIEVPKVSCSTRCGRTVLCTPQTAEQLVEVPTIVSFSLLQLIMEQNVGIPVPRGEERLAGPQGFLREQRRPSTVEQNVDIPAPGRGVQRGLQGFPKDGVQQRLVEQNIVFQQRLPSRTLTFQFPEVACTISLFLALQAHPQYRVMCVKKGFFALFPRVEKVRHYLRALGRRCLRARAHGRRLLMTSP